MNLGAPACSLPIIFLPPVFSTALVPGRSPLRVHSISPPPACASQVVLFFDLAAVFNSVVLLLFPFIYSNLLSYVFTLSSFAFVSIYYVIFSIVAGHQFSSAGIFAQNDRTVDSARFSQVLIVARATRRWPLAVRSRRKTLVRLASSLQLW